MSRPGYYRRTRSEPELRAYVEGGKIETIDPDEVTSVIDLTLERIRAKSKERNAALRKVAKDFESSRPAPPEED